MSTADPSQPELTSVAQREDVHGLTAPAIAIEFCPPCIALIKLRGEHDLNSKHALTKALASASAQLNILVDLSECTFIDSTVIAAFFRARESLRRRGGRLELLIPQSATNIRRLAQITVLDKILPIHETRRAAITSFQPQEPLAAVLAATEARPYSAV
jgi:anti-sigma B factor antagonist